MNYTLPFRKLSKNDGNIAGGKGASLGEMLNAGIPVPDGFVVLSTTFDEFIKETELETDIEGILDQVDHKAVHTVDEASEKIQEIIINAKMPKAIAEEVIASFNLLGSEFVAVRSSATAEDGVEHAWAGQLESYLNTTKKDLLEKVQKCWASLFTPRAIFYRFEKGLHTTHISVAVVVQQMVNSEKSGIAFSVHPVTEDFNQLIIEAGVGLGEAIVSGSVTPDSYVVEKDSNNIVECSVNHQNRALYRKAGGGNEWKDLDDKEADKQVLSNEEILELSKIIMTVENHYGFPCDIEWAYENNKFYIVQSRPITTLKKTTKEKIKLNKEHSRAYSLSKMTSWYKSLNYYFPKIIGAGLKHTAFIYNKKTGLVDVFYNYSELNKIFEIITELSNKKPQEVEILINKFLTLFDQLKLYFNKKIKIKTITEFDKVIDDYALYWTYVAIIFVLPKFDIPEKLKKLATEARIKTQEYNEHIEEVIKDFIKEKHFYLESKYRFVFPEEVNNKNIIKDEILKEIKIREDGFLYYQGKLYTGDVSKNLEKLNLFIEEEKYEEDSELMGQIAYKGKVKGRVRIITLKEQIRNFQEGEILVSPMTMPSYIQAMKIASAFITDEGGVTCHAAIVARELKKPCIIGTKVATQVLHDGDEVEVDADKGIVRILDNGQTIKSHKITEEILATKWFHLGKWIEPALAAELWLEYGSMAQNFFSEKLDKKILYLNGDFFLSQHDSDIFQNEGYEAARKKDKAFFENIYNLVKTTADEIIEKSKNISSVSDFLESYKKLTGVWMPLNNVAIGIEKYVQEVDSKAFSATKGFIDEKPWTLQQIDEMYELQEKIEKTIGKKIESPDEIPDDYKNEVAAHVKKYEWLGTHHFSIGQLTIENLVERMKQTKPKAVVDNSNKTNKDFIYATWLLDLIGYARFRAAEASGYTTYYLKDKLVFLGQEKGLTYDDIVEHTVQEIAYKNISKETVLRRKQNTGFYFAEKEYMLSDTDINECISALLREEVNTSDELRGLIAHKGRVTGKVKIVISKDQMEGFEDGMILVAHETTPDVIFAMQKSAAIVTDFGGLTSHAAIIARELGKPCVVGTKNATKVLKDGDEVEVDADKGIVKILK